MKVNDKQTRTMTGRTTIDSRLRTRSYSERAEKGDLETVEYTCPYCRHHKILATHRMKKCARCKQKIY